MGYLLFQFFGQSSECMFIEILFVIIVRIFTILTNMHRKTFFQSYKNSARNKKLHNCWNTWDAGVPMNLTRFCNFGKNVFLCILVSIVNIVPSYRRMSRDPEKPDASTRQPTFCGRRLHVCLFARRFANVRQTSYVIKYQVGMVSRDPAVEYNRPNSCPQNLVDLTVLIKAVWMQP